MRGKWLRAAEWALWFGMVVLLPFTSLPLVRKFFGSAMVAPPSAFFALGLAAIYLLPHLAKRGGLPPQVKPALALAVVAVLSALLAYTIPFPIFLNVNFTRHMLEAGLTLGVGLCFYFVSATWSADDRRLQKTLGWINWSGLVMLGWALYQAFVTRTWHDYPGWMDDAQAIFSSSQLFWSRATGFAYEPSWLAHQLNMLYLPLWLAASVRRASAHRFRLLGVSFENLLLVGGVVTLWMTVSRVGLAAFLLMIAFLLILANLWLVRWVQERLLPRLRLAEWLGLHRDQAALSPQAQKRWLGLARPLLRLELILLLVVIYAGLLFGAAQLLSRLDSRMSKMFDFSALSDGGFMAYANQLIFAERIVYWQMGWEVFNDYPLLGVGLGNTGYFFPQKMTGFGWSLLDINKIMFQDTGLPNTKSLWSRLLSETGILGFGAFLCWLLVIFLTGQKVDREASGLKRIFGLAAQLAIAALLLEGFSLDTFALPYFWITFGLATGAWKAGRRSESTEPELATISKSGEIA